MELKKKPQGLDYDMKVTSTKFGKTLCFLYHLVFAAVTAAILTPAVASYHFYFVFLSSVTFFFMKSVGLNF